MGQRYQRVFAATSRTANLSSAWIQTQGEDAITFDIDIASLTGTSVTFNIEGYDEAAGEAFTIISSTAATGAGRQAITVGPEVTAAANVAACRVLPLRMRVTTTGTWNPAVFSVAAIKHRSRN